MNKYVKKALKVLMWIVISIITLFLLVVILIQIPAVQNFVKEKAVTYLEDKIGTPVKIGRIEIGLPKKVILEDLYLQGQNGDTLLSGNKIAVDISLFKLFDNEVELNSVALEGIVANVSRNKDSIFNFGYIIDAFASKEPKDPTAAPMTFSLGKVTLDNIHVRFKDVISKNNLEAKLVHFDTEVDQFNLYKMDFDVPKIKLDGLSLKLKQGDLVREIAETTIQKTDSIVKTRPDLNIKLGEIEISKINISYDNAGTKLNSGITLKRLFLDFEKTDLPNQVIAINTFELEGVKAGLTFGKYELKIKPETIDSKKQSKNDWRLTLKDASLKEIDFRFDDENSAPVKRGIDYKHLNLSNLNLEAEALSYTAQKMSGNIRSLSADEKSGLQLQELRTNFTYGDNGAALKNLYLKTPQTTIREQIVVAYPSLESVKENPGSIAIDARLSNAKIAFKDILIFAPDLAKTNPFKDNPNAIVNINGQINGKLNNITIPNLEISGIGATKLSASGRITGLPDSRKSFFDLTIRNFVTTAKDINAIVPKGTIPNTIQLPSVLALRGTFKGSINNFNTNLALNSSFGNAKIKGGFDHRYKNRERYNGAVSLDNFDVGRLIKNDSLGKISLRANVNGVGLNPKTANAKVNGTIIKADFNSYTYRDLTLNGKIDNGKFAATAEMADPNLDFDLLTEGDFNKKYPEVKLKLNVDIADLDKLNLHAGALKLRGKVDADLATADPDFLNGKISAYHFVIANEKEQFQLDSVNIIATSTAERNTLQVKSQFLKATIDGKYQLTKIGTALTNSIAKYYDANPTAKKTATTPQQFAFDVKVTNDPVIMKLVPQITRLEPINIMGRYNSVNDTIQLNASIPRLVYGANTITNGIIKVDKLDNTLVYSAVIDEIQSDSFRLPYTGIEGTLGGNILTYRLNLKDAKDEDHYIIAGTLKRQDNATEVHLLPEELMLNYERWLIADNNVIRFGRKGIFADNFELSNDGSAIKIQSQSSADNGGIL